MQKNPNRPALGKITLIQLKPEQLQRYYSEKLSGGRYDGKGDLSHTTVSHHHTCLHRALKMALLQGHKDRQMLDRAMLGTPLSDNDFVFSDLEGKPLLPDTVSHAWAKLTQRTGLQGIRLRDAGHTHTSLMLKQGVHPKVVQERLGHATISTTLDLYSHIAPGLQEAAASGFDKIVLPKRELHSVKNDY